MAGVHNQNHRHTELLSKLCCAAPVVCARMAVEQAHDPFDNGHVSCGAGILKDSVDQRVLQEPGIQVPACPPAHQGVVCGIDVVGSDLERLHRDPALRQGGHEANRHSGLPNAAVGARDEEARDVYHADRISIVPIAIIQPVTEATPIRRIASRIRCGAKGRSA